MRLVSLSHTKQAISVDGRKSQTRSSRAGWGIKHSQGKTFILSRQLSGVHPRIDHHSFAESLWTFLSADSVD